MGAIGAVEAVVLVELLFAVAPLRRDTVGVEQPSTESAKPTNAVSMQMATHLFILAAAPRLDRASACPGH